MPCPALSPARSPFSPALKGLVNVSKLHIRQTSQTINLKDTHRVPAGFSPAPLASVVLTPTSLQKPEWRGGRPGEGYKVYPAVIKHSAFQKQPFDMWSTPKQNGINVLNATVFYLLDVWRFRISTLSSTLPFYKPHFMLIAALSASLTFLIIRAGALPQYLSFFTWFAPCRPLSHFSALTLLQNKLKSIWPD